MPSSSETVLIKMALMYYIDPHNAGTDTKL